MIGLLIKYVSGGLAAVVLLFVLYVLFVWAPVMLYTEAVCYEKGYPDYRLTVGLKKYCMALDGVVSVEVQAL